MTSTHTDPRCPSDVLAGQKYLLEKCKGAAGAGSVVVADQVALHVQSGDHFAGPTRIEATLSETSPCATGPAVNSEGVSAPRVLARWNQPEGVFPSATLAGLTLQNTAASAVPVTLYATALGLDGRSDKVVVGSYVVPGSSTVAATLRLDTLPIQSVGTWSQVDVTARYQEGDFFVESPAPTLHYQFDASYANATLSFAADADLVGASGSVRTDIVTLARTLANVRGRLLDHSTQVPMFVDVSTLRGGGFAQVGASRAVTANKGDWLPPPKKPSPGDPSGKVVVCSTWKAGFVDSGAGEDSLLGTVGSPEDVPARYAEASILDASGAATWEGFLDAGGCAPPLTLASGDYALVQAPSLSKPAAVDFVAPTDFVVDREAPGPSPGPDFILVTTAVVTSFTVSVVPAVPGSIIVRPAPHSHVTRVAAVASEIVSTDDMGLRTASTYKATIGVATEPPSRLGAHGSAEGLFVGANPVGVPHNSYWKFVVAHEFGHVVQDIATGLLPNNYSDSAPDAPCRCDHVDKRDPSNSLHCMQSREQFGAAHVEGFAQFYAAKLFNRRNEDDCTFFYYKEFLVGTLGGTPIIAGVPNRIECGAPAACTGTCPGKGWMENRCTTDGAIANKGVEWDQLNFLRSINKTTEASSTSMDDFNAIMREACGGRCDGKTRSFGQIEAAAATRFGGPLDPRALRFANAAAANGVEH